MSYARFGTDSDVYVYDHVDGWLACTICRLNPLGPGRMFPDDFQAFNSTQEMLDHLAVHIKAGHKVPPSTLSKLIDARDETDHWLEAGDFDRNNPEDRFDPLP